MCYVSKKVFINMLMKRHGAYLIVSEARVIEI
jgi:hypothetical protein